MFSSMATITSEAWTNQSPKNVNTYPHTYLLSSKTMRGSLFPLLPLRVKCQNHERVPISSISPILVVHALSSCQDTKIGEIGTLSWFWHFIKGKPWEGPYFPYFPQGWSAKTMRGSLFPLFPQGWSAKTMRGSLFPLFPLFWWSMSWQDE